MKPATLATWFADVTVHFVHHPPSEDVIRFAHLCAKERWLSGALIVVVERSGDESAPQHRIRIARPGQEGVMYRGAELLPAIRDAFDRFDRFELA